MSRHADYVSVASAKKIFGESAIIDIFGEDNPPAIQVVHGFDAPCTSYFCDLAPDFEVGIYYGGIGLGKELSRWDYVKALRELGLDSAADAVSMDMAY